MLNNISEYRYHLINIMSPNRVSYNNEFFTSKELIDSIIDNISIRPYYNLDPCVGTNNFVIDSIIDSIINNISIRPYNNIETNNNIIRPSNNNQFFTSKEIINIIESIIDNSNIIPVNNNLEPCVGINNFLVQNINKYHN